MGSTNNFDSRNLSISEMAKILGLTRQTLIYYDKIDLFKPVKIEENGYRLYSPVQIPVLRELCFLRSVGMPLEDIKKYLSMSSSATSVSLLNMQKENLEKEISRLTEQLNILDERLALYNKTNKSKNEPYIKHFNNRYLIYGEINGKPSRDNFREAMTYAVKLSEKFSILPTSSYGTLFKEEAVKAGTPLKSAYACFMISEHESKKTLSYFKLPAGEYLCLKKQGRSYNLSALSIMIEWISENGYEIIGDVYEELLMDGMLYDNPKEMDFSEIQIPIKKIN